jgi:hypothetical protein
MREAVETTQAQQRGKDIHTILEHYLEHGTIQEDHPLGYFRYIQWLQDLLPDPTSERLAVEQKIILCSSTGQPYAEMYETPGVPFIGFIDIGMFDRDPLTLGDLKTLTNFRYAKTPAELAEDIQMNAYAKWCFEVDSDLDTVRVGHYYVKVEAGQKPAPKRIRSTKIMERFVDISRSANEDRWGQMQETMREMTEIAMSVDDFNDLTPNVNACDQYGGCAFKEKCGINAKDKLFQITRTKTNDESENTMGFLDKLKKTAEEQSKEAEPEKIEAKAEETEAEEEAPKPVKKTPAFLKKKKAAPKEETEEETVSASTEEEEPEKKVNKKAAAKEPEGILPPDGAERTTSDERGAEIRKDAEDKKQAKEKKASAKKAPAKKRTSKKRGLTLYIGCVPVKGEHLPYTLLDDWLREDLEELNAHVAQTSEGKKLDYRQLGFGDSKVALAQTVQGKINNEGLPSVLVCLSSSGANPMKEAADLLIPHATDVISA